MHNSEKDFLVTRTAEYSPQGFYSLFFYTRARPPFSHIVIRDMLADPRVLFGLWLLKGPITDKATFTVESENSEVAEFLQKQIERFWRNSAGIALKAVEWGYSGSEVLYHRRGDKIEFDRLKDIHASDLKAITHKGNIVGMYVQRTFNENSEYYKYVYVGGPKKFWHVHWKDRNPWYGLSRLYGCYIPWWEKWSDGGYRDIRRLWFHKNAFEGGTFYFPFGGSTRDENGNIVSFQALARELLEKKRTGGMMFLPNIMMDDKGNRAWEYVPPEGNAVPPGLLDYGDKLDKEILEGLGVPGEIIESSGEQGFGASSGRQVPETAFYAILQELVHPLVDDFSEQIAKPLVRLNFGEDIEFDIIANPLAASTDQDDGGMPMLDEEGNPIADFPGEEIDPNDPSSNQPPGKSGKSTDQYGSKRTKGGFGSKKANK